MNGGVDLAALVAARLCHDLVSPLGAIGNGIELLELVMPPSPELTLTADAARAAQERLRLYRLGFGTAAADQRMRGDEVMQIARGLATNGRIDLRGALPGTLPRPQARRLILAALCAESALAWGGAVVLAADRMRAEAARLRLDAALWQALAQGKSPADPTPADVHFTLLAASGPVRLTQGEGWLEIAL